MNYSKFAEESRKLYHALRDNDWNDNEAYEIAKICIREFPIFREIIEEEKKTVLLGYVHFKEGTTAEIINVVNKGVGDIRYQTANESYREKRIIEYETFLGTTIKTVYERWEGAYGWQDCTDLIAKIELL